MLRYTFLFVILAILASCEEYDPNLDEMGKDLLESKEIFIDENLVAPFQDTVYVPIYSEIYSKTKNDRILLTATLSIRNTSLTDSMIIRDIDYYDTNGKMVRRYIDKTLLLMPMQSIEYVIEEADKTGGVGANFIINWGARTSTMKPIFQGVMMAINGQHGFAFTTDGISIRQQNLQSKSIQNSIEQSLKETPEMRKF